MLAPEVIETPPDVSMSLEPLLMVMDPDGVDEDDPLRTRTEPSPPEEVESSALPPDPLEIITEPPCCEVPAPAVN